MKVLTCILFVQMSIVASSSENIIEVTDIQVWDYWELDHARMDFRSGPEPVDLDLHGGVIQFKYTYLIDVDGNPKDFNFISADPKSAEIEKDKIKKYVFASRYLRKKGSKHNGATLVIADEKWWRPDPSTVTF